MSSSNSEEDSFISIHRSTIPSGDISSDCLSGCDCTMYKPRRMILVVQHYEPPMESREYGGTGRRPFLEHCGMKLSGVVHWPASKSGQCQFIVLAEQCAHTRTHKHAHKHTYTHTHIHTHSCLHTNTHTHIHTHKHTCTHARTHSCTHTVP